MEDLKVLMVPTNRGASATMAQTIGVAAAKMLNPYRHDGPSMTRTGAHGEYGAAKARAKRKIKKKERQKSRKKR